MVATSKIAFKHNTNNKLNATIFTAIGMYDSYFNMEKVDVYLADAFVKKVQIIHKYKVLLQNIPDVITLLDSGVSQEEFSVKIKEKYKADNYDWNTKHLFIYVLKTLK